MSKGNKQPDQFIGRKRKNSPLKPKNLEIMEEFKAQENGTAYLTYKLDKKYKYIKLFGNEFVENNKKNCKIIIYGKEYEMVKMIKEFIKYGINEEEETLEVILKGEKISDMSYMFYGCNSVVKFNLSSFNTQNVTNMSGMYCGCNSLIELDLSSFNTQNVTNMSDMFGCCNSLIELDLSLFNTQNVTDMSYMFYGCDSLIELDLSSFNTQNVTDMSRMFDGRARIVKIKRKNFNKIKVCLKLNESRSFIVEI